MLTYENKARYLGVDILKAFCAFLVVCIHCPFVGIVGDYIVMVARIAVPIFFMITGFFYADIVRKGHTRIQIQKIFFLFLKANLLYLLWEIMLIFISVDNIKIYFKQTVTIKVLIKFLIFNDSPFGGHLWYLGAILYVLIINEILNKKSFQNVLYIITPILLLGDLSLGKYSLLLFGREFSYVLVRNFLFVGLPYFCIGKLIRRIEEGSITDEKVYKIKRCKYMVLCVIVLIANIMEKHILVSIGANATRDHYFSTTLLAILVFILAIQQRCLTDNKVLVLFSSIGKKYSTWIYIMHPIFIIILDRIAVMTKLNKNYEFFGPIIVYFVTLTMGVVWSKMMTKWMGMKNECN